MEQCIKGVKVFHVIGTYGGKRYMASNWRKPCLPDGSEGEWTQIKTVRELWGSWFEHYKTMEIAGVYYKEDGEKYCISADEVLESWDPFWSRETYDDPYKIYMKEKEK